MQKAKQNRAIFSPRSCAVNRLAQIEHFLCSANLGGIDFEPTLHPMLLAPRNTNVVFTDKWYPFQSNCQTLIQNTHKNFAILIGSLIKTAKVILDNQSMMAPIEALAPLSLVFPLCLSFRVSEFFSGRRFYLLLI